MDPQYYNRNHFYIGILLAVLSSLFIGSSFIIKKLSLIKLSKNGGVRAGAGGYGYLRDWLWWVGFLTMGVGELANFGAYAFAPASQITPLGALSVLVSTIMASQFLNESINIFGKLGSFLCILGSTVIVIHAPKEEQIGGLNELVQKMQGTAFANFLIMFISISVIIVVYIGPRYGSRYVTVYITLCSIIGSMTVMACKALGLAIKDCFKPLSPGLTYESAVPIFMLLIFIAACICLQMNYLNKALDIFTTNVVTPIYYVMFTTCVIVASSVLFREWEKMKGENVLGSMCGFFTVVVAIFMLNSFKDNEGSHRISQQLPRYNSNSKYSYSRVKSCENI